MAATLHKLLREAHLDAPQTSKERLGWCRRHPSQLVLTAAQIGWCEAVVGAFEAPEAARLGALEGVLETARSQLADLAREVSGDLPHLLRRTLVALITALVLNRDLKARAFWRAVFFFPVLLSPVVVGLIWRWILQREGLLNLFMYEAGLDPVDWLVERNWAFTAAILVSVWAHVGFYALILLAGLQAIPKDLYEAAEMDGTRPSRMFWRITLPLLAPNLLVVLVLTLIRAVQIFDEVYVLTGGGPGTSTLFITQYIYEVGFASLLRNPGLASAASILMGAVLVILTLVQLGIARRNEIRSGRR
jgi:ABC-type sugar transport system permease subunit